MTERNHTKSKKIGANADRHMYWWMCDKCNFKCAYCFRQWGENSKNQEHLACEKYSAEHVIAQFDNTASSWHIRMTGGEPFLCNDFVKLAKGLTDRHYLTINTNLSTPNVYEFADKVDSKRICSINASLHIDEREKSKDGVAKFLKKNLYLQELGFDIKLLYVTYLPHLRRIKKDIEFFRAEGVKQIRIKVFQGKYKDKRYPRDYTDEQRDLIKELGITQRENELLVRRVSFLGRKCESGRTAFAMDLHGNVTRCITVKEKYGNFFDGTFKASSNQRRCPMRKCSCTNQGINFAEGQGFRAPSKIITKPTKFLISASEKFAGSDTI